MYVWDQFIPYFGSVAGVADATTGEAQLFQGKLRQGQQINLTGFTSHVIPFSPTNTPRIKIFIGNIDELAMVCGATDARVFFAEVNQILTGNQQVCYQILGCLPGDKVYTSVTGRWINQ